ncbi:MAG: response regulator transcription factor [Actinomycetes bacterium]
MKRDLTAQEVRVLELFAHGFTRDQVAHRMGLSPHTVKSHLARIYDALDARTCAHAVGIAYRWGLLGVAPRTNGDGRVVFRGGERVG